MATIKTTAKRNPITGDPIPAPSYTKGRGSNFAGTDRKREPVIPQAKSTGTTGVGTVRGAGNVKKQNTTNSAASSGKERKTRLERQMEVYGVEPVTNSKYSPREQRQRNRTRLKLAKDKARAAKPTPGMDKVRDKMNQVLGRGKYDRGSMGKNMSLGGNRSKLNIDKSGQKKQEVGCKISMAGKFKQAFKRQKPAQNVMWTISK